MLRIDELTVALFLCPARVNSRLHKKSFGAIKEAMSESKRRQRTIVSDKIDKTTTAYHIIVTHLGGLSESAEIAVRPVPTVYGWLSRGRVPAGQQNNLSDRAEEAGKPFPSDWYLKVPEPETVAEAA